MEENEEMFIDTYYRFLHTDYAYENVIGCAQEMDKVFARVSGQNDEDDEDETSKNDDELPDNEQQEETEDWMLLCRLNQHYEQSSNQQMKNGTDWFEAARSVPMDLLKECPGWICTQRKDAEEQGRRHSAQIQYKISLL